MLLTKFLKAKDALNDLGKCHLRVSKAEELNDPFEFLPREDSIPDSFEEFKRKFQNSAPFRKALYSVAKKQDPNLDEDSFRNRHLNNDQALLIIFQSLEKNQLEVFKSTREKISSKNLYICSFSKHLPDDAKAFLLWSHYADSHKGIAITFESELIQTAGDDIQDIKYQKRRAPYSLINSLLDKKEVPEQLQKSFFTKSKHWKYEKEVRWFVPIENCTDQFVKLDKQAFKEICFGLNCSEDKIKCGIKIIKSEYPWVKAYRSKLHNKEFKLIPEEIDIHNYQ